MHRFIVLALLCSIVLADAALGQTYQADWDSLDTRPLPSWFNEAKFGIFVVWGPYSVPAWKDRGYAEWYGNRMNRQGSPTWNFHRRVYGEDFHYEDFAPLFKAELWDPQAWCDLFARSGAKYVVTTANYHDGFAMYPTEHARFNDTDRWNSVERGPQRDIIGELNEAGTERGLKMGIYYSLYEWYHPLWKNKETQDRYVTEHLHPKFKEVVTRYKPWFIFLDGEWAADYKFWKSEPLAAWLYNESPCRDYVVVNDRWGQCRGLHGDVFESEYGGGDSCSPDHPWQEDRGMGLSYGYNRAESIDDYDSAATLIQMLVRCTANGGNYLLCVGPTGDGRIPVIMQQRLVEIGDWLKVNGEAIYGAEASPFWPRRFEWGYVSAKPGTLFLHVFEKAIGHLELTGLENRVARARLLAHPQTSDLISRQENSRLILDWPAQLNDSACTTIALDVDGPFRVSKTQHQFADGSIALGCRALRVDGTKAHVYYRGHGETARIVDWTDPGESIEAGIYVNRPGVFNVQLTYGASKSSAATSQLELRLGGRSIRHQVADTGGDERFKAVAIGQIEIDAAGPHTLSLQPRPEGWKGVGLQSIDLVLREE